MATKEITGDEEVDEMLDSFVNGGWYLASLVSLIVLFIYKDNPQIFNPLLIFALALVAGAPLFFLMSDIHDRKDADWGLFSAYFFAGVIGVFIVALAYTLAIRVFQPSLTITNYLQLGVLNQLSFTPLTLLTTAAFVASGEEALKAFMWIPIIRGIGSLSERNFFWVATIPGFRFSTQPPVFLAIVIWALAHIFLGQNQWSYFFPVLIDGMIISECAFRGKDQFLAVVIHLTNNTVFQVFAASIAPLLR